MYKRQKYNFAQLVDLWIAVETLGFEYDLEQSIVDPLQEKIGSDFLRLITQDEPIDPVILGKIQVTMLRHYLIEQLYKNKWILKNTLQGHTRPVSSVAFSSDGQLVVTSSQDHTAKLWNAKTGLCIATLNGHVGGVCSAVFSPDGKLVLTASWDNTAKLWNAQTGECIATLGLHTDHLRSAIFSPDGQWVVTASRDHTAKLWNAQTGQLSRDLQGHTGMVTSVAFSPDSQRLVTGSGDNTTKLWNAQTGQLLRTLQGHTGHVNSAAFSPDGLMVATGSSDSTAKIWINNFLKAGITTLGQALQLAIQDVLHIFKTGESIQSARRKWRKEYDFIRSIGDTKVIDFQPNQNKTSLDDVD
ncbi:WD40 repeat domain-containing protein [bacterium]|nr:WD40 repeat domain-containing protein [Candidatus Elulimicrobium humile]